MTSIYDFYLTLIISIIENILQIHVFISRVEIYIAYVYFFLLFGSKSTARSTDHQKGLSYKNEPFDIFR